MTWYQGLGIRAEKMRFHQHGPDELAHYAKDAYDIQYEFPFGWQEFEGIHNRTGFDLANHQKHSGKKLEDLEAAPTRRAHAGPGGRGDVVGQGRGGAPGLAVSRAARFAS